MSEATVRGHIKTVLESVSNIGQVHDYERWATTWDDFLSHFKTTISDSDVIRGWTITCPGWAQEYLPGSYPQDKQAIVVRNYVYKIRGYLGLDDTNASEKTAIALAEDVVEALDIDETLHETLETTKYWDEVPPAQLDVFEPRLFGSTLCHYIEITQRAREVIAL